MSANNQTLIAKHNDKYYVFDNIQAESWCDEDGTHINELSIKGASGVWDDLEHAYLQAQSIEAEDDMGGTEYGIQVDELIKDGAKVILIDNQ